jgi:hypothetical protein
MIKIGETVIERETAYVIAAKPICVAILPGSIKLWRKGTQESYTIGWDRLYIDAKRSSFTIAPRAGAITQKTAAALINRDLEAALRAMLNDPKSNEYGNPTRQRARDLLLKVGS